MYSFIHRISFLSLIILIPFFCQAQHFELEEESFSSKSIDPGVSHTYEIELSAQELLMVRFEQESSDIAIRVLDPEGELIEEFDGNNGDKGPELVIIDPQISGKYSLIPQPLEEQKKPGNYRVKIDRRLKKGNGTGEVLDQLIEYWADQGYLPGFATVVLSKDEVLFQQAYGYADLEEEKAYSLESIQNIGSVSKTLIGLALMHAVEEGKLKLEDEVNPYLPFEVINPYHPDKPIRIIQLANHTSSIGEMEAYERSYVLREAFTYEKGEIGRGEFEEMEFYAQNPDREMGKFL
ncbi:MAG: serine hydrolase domain-containing protein, partial [Bacteroidota bacterium]